MKSRLARKLTALDATILGLGSMIGAGIFVVAGPGADAAGSGLIIAVLLAGGIAFLNAMAMAQLAVLYPESGGTYVYGRKQLSPYWGFLAGWGFVIGKIASCAAMALTFAFYLNEEHARGLAVVTVLLLTGVNFLGIRKTVLATKIFLLIALLALITVGFSAAMGGAMDVQRLSQWTARGGVAGILQATGLVFFAFAGYARIATLGEEVIAPQKNIPRAIFWALGLTVIIYSLLISATLMTVDLSTLVQSKTPLLEVLRSSGFERLSVIVRMGAIFAALGVLLSLLAGVGRTVFAMAAAGDLPNSLSRVHPVRRVPHIAELSVGFVVAVLVSVADIRSVIGFSSFAILIYYAIANFAAFTLGPNERRWPRWTSLLGFVLCLATAGSLPVSSLLGGAFLFIAASGIYWLRLKIKGKAELDRPL